MDASDVIKAICNYMNDFGNDFGIIDIVKFEDVTGDKQDCDCELFDHEYCDQWQRYEDWREGYMYFPIGNEEYIKVWYNS